MVHNLDLTYAHYDAYAKKLLMEPEILELLLRAWIPEFALLNDDEMRKIIAALDYREMSGIARMNNSELLPNGLRFYLDRSMMFMVHGIKIIVNFEPDGYEDDYQKERTMSYLAALIEEQHPGKDKPLIKVYLGWISMMPKAEIQGSIHKMETSVYDFFTGNEIENISTDDLPLVVNANLIRITRMKAKEKILKIKDRTLRILCILFTECMENDEKYEELAKEGIYLSDESKEDLKNMENCTYGLYVEGRKSGFEEGVKSTLKSAIMNMLRMKISNDTIIQYYPDYDNDKLDEMRKEIEDENNRK